MHVAAKGDADVNNRIDQLDAIRGVASFTVVLHHLYLVVPMLPLLLKYSPLRVLVNGHAPVILFFVLSGFVLALPYWSGTSGTYRTFMTRRFFRIYIPYLMAIIVSVTADALFANGSIPGIVAWQSGISIPLLVEHIVFLYIPDTQAFNNVIWSLVHEMRISLIFPLIVIIAQRFSWRLNMIVCFLLSILQAGKGVLAFPDAIASLAETMHYASMFIMGALIAKNRERLIEVYVNWSRFSKWSVLFAAFFLYSYSTVINSVFLGLGLPNEFVVSDYAAAAASGVMIVYALGSAKLANFLLLRPLLFLGKISYSLYLYHIVVLFSLSYLFHEKIPGSILYAGTILLSLIFATLSWKYIERPAIAWGKKYTA